MPLQSLSGKMSQQKRRKNKYNVRDAFKLLAARAVPSLFEWNGFTNSTTRAGVWERRTRPVSSPLDPVPVETEEEEMMVPMLVEHDYAASSMVFIDREELKKIQEEIEVLRQQVQTLHLQTSFGLQRFASSPEDIRFYTR